MFLLFFYSIVWNLSMVSKCTICWLNRLCGLFFRFFIHFDKHLTCVDFLEFLNYLVFKCQLFLRNFKVWHWHIMLLQEVYAERNWSHTFILCCGFGCILLYFRFWICIYNAYRRSRPCPFFDVHTFFRDIEW